MTEKTDKIETKEHIHVDNGGITIHVTTEYPLGKDPKTDPPYFITSISLETAYFGYPAITSTLTQLNMKQLDQLIETLRNHQASIFNKQAWYGKECPSFDFIKRHAETLGYELKKVE